MAESKKIIVDGANVAYIETTYDGKPRMSNIVQAVQKLEEKGFEPIVIVDAAFQYEVDDPRQIEGLLGSGKIQQAPAGTDADYFIIKTAEEEHAQILTNDLYSDYIEKYPWIRQARVPLMIIDGDLILYYPSLE